MKTFSQHTTNNTNQKQIFSKSVLGKVDNFVKYEQALSQPIDHELVKKYNGSHLALWALGKNLKTRIATGEKIKRGNYYY